MITVGICCGCRRCCCCILVVVAVIVMVVVVVVVDVIENCRRRRRTSSWDEFNFVVRWRCRHHRTALLRRPRHLGIAFAAVIATATACAGAAQCEHHRPGSIEPTMLLLEELFANFNLTVHNAVNVVVVTFIMTIPRSQSRRMRMAAR